MKRTAHRPDRESERNNLRSENKSLRRQVARLQKRVTKLAETEPAEVERIETEEAAASGTCPHCGSSNLGTWRAPSGKVIVGCRSCKRGRL